MAKRMILMLGVTALLLATLAFVKFKQVGSAAHAAAYQPPPEAVTSIVAEREQWPATMGVIGTMEAVRGVTVSADLPGVVERILFDSGQSVRAGAVLVELDTRQEDDATFGEAPQKRKETRFYHLDDWLSEMSRRT